MMPRGEEAHKQVTADERRPGRLVVLSGADAGTQLVLDRPVLTVGRSPACDLVLSDRRVSSRHARIEVGRRHDVLTDAGSTNGTWCSGRRLSDPVVLADGDLVTFAGIDARYEAGGPLPAARGAGARTRSSSAGPARPGTALVAVSDAADSDALVPLAAAVPVEVVPAARRRTLLVSHDPADRATADLLVDLLQRAGHLVWIDHSTRGDGWGGRLLDTVWASDGIVFVVSPAAAVSEAVHREVHLAGAERTPVVPVVVAPTDLPPDLAFYLTRRAAVDLCDDAAGGLRCLLDEVETLPRKVIARPRHLALMLLLTTIALALAVAGVRYALG